jgi:hypothetical protein
VPIVLVVRALLAAVTLAIVVGLSVLVTSGPTDGGVTVVSAAPSNVSRHPEKEEKNRNENWNGNNNGNGNSNGNDNGNSVDDGDDDRGSSSANRRGSQPSAPPLPPSMAGRCFAAGQSGALTLILDGGTVTLNVVTGSSFPRDSRVTLGKVDPASVPATPGPRLDELVFELRAQEGCDGSALSELPADANLGVSYRVPADKPTVRIAFLDGGAWVDVPTVPDPSNPYVSATVRRTGVYTVYQAR